MPVAVPILAGTAIRGLAATVMMRHVLERHHNAFLITLAHFGVAMPLERSQGHIHNDIQAGLAAQGREPGSPVVLVGHSQGGLAALRYAVDHQDQVRHVISVGAPWEGSVSAARISRLFSWTGRNITPALSDMAEGSPFLTDLHADVPAIADRVTNIYSTHELFIQPYINAHMDVPGVTNLLIATEDEYRRHLRAFPEYEVDDLIMGRITHLGEMSSPEVRSRIWAKVEEISDQVRREG
ncbi:MAG: alpha/beta hydrolase, partial [Chloroflexi bacterium]|nr:alpha/beta hydrolase [Chloroflexota bacterium]